MLLTPDASKLKKAWRVSKQPTEAGVNTNQSRLSAQGQFAATGAFAEKNSKNRANQPLTPTLSHRERELNAPILLEERR
jgi:hypothetical protein